MLSLLTLPIRGLFLRSRVAWRACALFLLAALLPMLLLAVLTGTQLSSMAREQQLGQLALAGAQEASAIQTRLQDAQAWLDQQAEALRQGRVPETDGRTLVRIELQPPLIEGEQGVDLLVQTLWARGGSALLLQRDARGPHLQLLRAVDPARPELGLLRGELAPALFSADIGGQARQIQACLLDARGQAWVCTDPALAPLAQRLVSHQLEAGDEGWLHHVQGLALRARYAADDWTLVMLQPEGSGIAAWARLASPFLGVLLLALLLGVLLSGVQLRRTLVPLERLIEGTHRIAREDFNQPVQLLHHDEFGQLGQALNSMAARLGQQMSTLRALAEIDHEILSRADMEQVIARVQERLHELWPQAVTSMVVFDPQQSADFGIVHLHAGEQGVTAKVPSKLEPWLLERLARDYDGMWFDVGGGELPDFLSLVADAGARRILVLPIFWREQINGLMAIGLMEPLEFNNERVQQARDLARRIGVALAVQARDEQRRFQTFHDTQTGLPNRALLLERLTQQMAQARRNRRQLAVFYIDLDRFKKVNDTQGHEVGNRLLCQLAERLTTSLREGDTVARVGGDEFVVLLPGLSFPKQAARLAREMQGLVAEPFLIDGRSSQVTASIGVALFPDDGGLPSELLKKADTAMHRAKAAGRQRILFYGDSLNLAQQEQAALEAELRLAIARGQLALHYQPRMQLADGQLAGAEALLGWVHPELGSIPRERFIPLAEEAGLIDEIGGWMLQQVCAQLGRWQAVGYRGCVSVQVSGRQLRSGQLVPQLQQALAAGQTAAAGLVLEFTESALAADFEAAGEQLGRIQQTGVMLALDGFGTGTSSLGHLQRLPFDILKIAGSFTQGLGQDADADGIVHAIIALAHALGKTVVAEGVEQEQQAEQLHSWHCEQAQGGYYSVPLTADEFEELLIPSRPAEIF